MTGELGEPTEEEEGQLDEQASPHQPPAANQQKDEPFPASRSEAEPNRRPDEGR